ncbi:MAG TPA: hypothetical protein VD973_28080 [Symbiobacteriaceae bacterium]|nr:hypothetical protein [Symbiobacteriaceae bacterium]
MEKPTGCRPKLTEALIGGLTGGIAVWVGWGVVSIFDCWLSDAFGLTPDGPVRRFLYPVVMFLGAWYAGIPVVRWLYSVDLRLRRSARRPLFPHEINVQASIWQWHQVLRRIEVERDLHRKQEMVRQLSFDMNKAYWRWRIWKKYT